MSSFKFYTQVAFFAGLCAVSCYASSNPAAEQSVNLPGVQKITQEFDQKFVPRFNESNKKVAEISKKINDMSADLVSQCKDQEKLSDHCKSVLSAQTDLQIEMFETMASAYKYGVKLMEAKKKSLR